MMNILDQASGEGWTIVVNENSARHFRANYIHKIGPLKDRK